MNETIDKIAEKLGTGIEAARPLAETVVREYMMVHWVQFGMCIVIGGLFAAVGVWALVHGSRTKNSPEFFIGLGTVSGLIGMIVLFVGSAGNLARALAPHYYLLKDLFGS